MARETLTLENATIFWTNFAGAERTYNPAGRRNFCVELNPDIALELKSKGWNVKERLPREEGEETKYHIQVEVKYDANNPRWDPEIYLVEKNVVKLSEREVGILDDADILNVDLEINPYDWGTARNGYPAIKAYVKTMYVTIKPNILSQKYRGYGTETEADENELPF